jgi:hypothetical protein
LLQFGVGRSGTGISCDPGHRGVSDRLATALSRRTRSSLSDTLGVVPPDGWAHRSFLAGLSGGGAPCQVSYRLTARDGDGHEWRADGVIEAPESQTVPTREIGAEDVELKGLIEQDRSTRQPIALLRVLARNRGRVAASIGISSIALSCPDGHQPRRDLHYTTLQGEDVGPTILQSSAAHVFVIGIDIPARGLSDCSAAVGITAFEKGGPRSLTTFDVDLEPGGFFDLGGHGFR